MLPVPVALTIVEDRNVFQLYYFRTVPIRCKKVSPKNPQRFQGRGSSNGGSGSRSLKNQLRPLQIASPHMKCVHAIFTASFARFMSTPLGQQAYQPSGEIALHFPGHENATDYRQSPDLVSALAEVSYKRNGVDYRREVFASHPHQAMVIRLSADGGTLDFIVGLDCPTTHNRKRMSQMGTQ